jgi:radical SAM superfamily enzyme YgiQ (UPF0313 family)
MENLETKPDLFLIYANQASNHESVIGILQTVTQNSPKIPVYIVENTQAVTAYSVSIMRNSFINMGATDVLVGDSDISIMKFFNSNKQFPNTPGLVISNDLDSLPFPDWDSIPLENYWSLGFGHGPVTSSRYLPILTSRGCPFSCEFCVVPGTNNRKWRARSPKSVISEISFFQNKYEVNEYHLEDLNPTIDLSRELQIADEILKNRIKISWKIVAGTKAETLKNQESIIKLKQSGCDYISFSPESGSNKIKKSIGKRFDNNHALNLVQWCKRAGIETQACFVLGMPSENFIDRLFSLFLSLKLTARGLSEIAVFIITPIAGSKIYDKNLIKNVNNSNISFSPNWRSDYFKLNFFRIIMYLSFLLLKFIKSPRRLIKSIRNFRTKQFELKMEMAPHRAMSWKKWSKNV